jgi:fructose-bisphosphate aldolase, class II
MVRRSRLGAAKNGTRPSLNLVTAFAYKHRSTATTMPVANYKTYCKMLDRARAGRFAFPAINVTSLTTANAVLRGLAGSKSDGITQVSTGGGAFASGSSLKDMALGAIAIAEHVHRAAERYPIYVALHTDHCLQDKLDRFVLPLVEQTESRRAAGQPNLFTGHMFDGSNLGLQENLEISAKLLERFTKNDLVLEIETGAVGGEEDDVVGDKSGRLYTTPEDTLEVARRLNPIGGRYLLAARLRRGKDERGHRHAVCVHPRCRRPHV